MNTFNQRTQEEFNFLNQVAGKKIPRLSKFEINKIKVFCAVYNFTFVYDENNAFLVNENIPNLPEFIQQRKYYIRKFTKGSETFFFAKSNTGDKIVEISDEGFDKMIKDQHLLVRNKFHTTNKQKILDKVSQIPIRDHITQFGQAMNKIAKTIFQTDEDFVNDQALLKKVLK